MKDNLRKTTMKNFKNISTTKRNNLGLFFQLSFFALFAMLTLFSGQTLATNCTPSTPLTTVTEGNLFPGGIASFGVMSGPGSVTVDHVNAGTGLQSLTVLGTPTNATVNIPAFTPGTYNPVTVTFTVPNTSQAVDFTLRAASTFHALNIRVRCLAPTPTPTPTPTASPTPRPTPTPTPQIQGCTGTIGFWRNNEDEWAVQSLTLGTVNYTKAQLLQILNQPVQGNGLISLSQQLIAAKLAAAAGATVPASIATAIADADALIGGLIVPPVGGGSLSTGSTSSLNSTLATYNRGETPGGPPHCGN